MPSNPLVRLEVDKADLAAVQAQLKALPAEVNASLRAQVRPVSQMLARQVNEALVAAPAPQAHRFDRSARPKSDRYPVVKVGGRAREGDFDKGMGVLNAVEWGSKLERFKSPRNASGYAIGPAVQAFGGTAWRWYQRILDRVAADANAKG